MYISRCTALKQLARSLEQTAEKLREIENKNNTTLSPDLFESMINVSLVEAGSSFTLDDVVEGLSRNLYSVVTELQNEKENNK